MRDGDKDKIQRGREKKGQTDRHTDAVADSQGLERHRHSQHFDGFDFLRDKKGQAQNISIKGSSSSQLILFAFEFAFHKRFFHGVREK